MTLRPFPLKPERSSMLAETRWRSWIDTLGQVQRLRVLLRAEGGQYARRRERRLMQPNSDSVIDSVGDRRDGGGERSLAAFLRAKWALRVDTLDYDRLHVWRFHRRWA